MTFNFECEVPVTPPFRLDLTTDALRRLAANVVDVVAEDGTYSRAFANGSESTVVLVRQVDERRLHVAVCGADPEIAVARIERMLGIASDLREWRRRAAQIPWLAHLADELGGLRPPRYPDLWEALAHSIVFQQISIHAAASIMRRLVLDLSAEIHVSGRDSLRPFPTPALLLAAPHERLRSAGLSANKVAHLRSAAQAVESQAITEAMLAPMASEDASAHLCGIRGIGPWSAAVVLLRGLGRLDVFPMRDSGVARSLRLLSGSPDTTVESVLDVLGPVRGMLYFHLLLGRLRNLVPG
ncbi:MAG: hypothetical protein M3Y18_04070 [Candidatus Eremiobacteraeota bacterium]|nr:hypothetical protein [Candidatus Eremiobacteraeota bacterium]